MVGIFLFLPSCYLGIEEPQTEISGAEFYPLELGNFHIYHVVDTTYTLGAGMQVQRFYRKEQIIESFEDLAGNLSFAIQISRSDAPEGPWQQDSVWRSHLETIRAIRIANNQAFIDLSFPIALEKTWDSNALNAMAPKMFRYLSRQESLTIGSNSYEQVLEVERDFKPDFISEFIDERSWFASNIGLIKKQDVLYKYCILSSCLGQQIVEEGYHRTWELVAYGKE